MRLGDLDALKEILINEYEAREHYIGEIMLKAIDNAPTVKFSLMPADESKEEAYLRGYKKGKVEGILKARPQGEWKLHGMIWYCSNCGKDCEQGGNNFCGNCGAKMGDIKNDK